VVAQAYQYGRRLAMTLANTNHPVGKAYNKAFNNWCKRTHFDLGRVNEPTRTAMGHIMDNQAAFEAWRRTLAGNQRELWNHPCTMWRHFAAARRRLPSKAKVSSKSNVQRKGIDLKCQVKMLQAELAKAQEGQLLVDLAHDDPAAIVRALVND